MNKNVIIGRYFQGNSMIHKLDARAKLLMGFYYIVLVMFTHSLWMYGALILYVLLFIKLAGIPLGFFWKGLRPLTNIILFTAAIQIFFVSGGPVWLDWGPLRVTQHGLWMATTVFFRFALTIFMSTAISLTTRPIDFTDAVEYLLSPLKKVKVPVQDFALMLSIAMRFIPTLMDEANRIKKAQESRGVSFGEGNIFEQMKKLIPVFLPLFISSFFRAEELANALDVRGYQGANRRTKLRLQTWKLADTLFLTSCVLLTAGLFI